MFHTHLNIEIPSTDKTAFFSKISRQNLGPLQSPTQWAPSVISSGIRAAGLFHLV